MCKTYSLHRKSEAEVFLNFEIYSLKHDLYGFQKRIILKKHSYVREYGQNYIKNFFSCNQISFKTN